MKKLKVDKDMCIGCGMCFSTDEEHFTSDDNGLSEVKSQENLDSENLKNVVESCPVGAIKIEEEN